MMQRALFLRVVSTAGCRILRSGDQWSVSDGGVCGLEGAGLCLHALHQFYPALVSWLDGDATGEPVLQCLHGECRASFVVELRSIESPDGPSGMAAQPGEARRPGSELGVGSFMSRLSRDLALEIVAVAGRRQGDWGTEFLAAGTRGERLFIVAEGQVEVVLPSAHGRAETELAVLGPGDCFGEMAILTDRPTSATVRARGPCLLYTLTRPQLERLLDGSPELAYVFSQLLAERLRSLNRTLENEMERGMRGQLTTLPLSDLVQLLLAGHQTGTVVLSGPGLEARLGFEKGRLVSAEAGTLRGEEAFFALMSRREGLFRLEETLAAPSAETGIRTDTLALLMEALRRLDEAQAEPG